MSLSYKTRYQFEIRAERNTLLATYKLTSKFRMTVPSRVRRVLGLEAGDLVAFEIEGTQVSLLRVDPLDLAFIQAMEGTLPEWSCEKDDRAFKDL